LLTHVDLQLAKRSDPMRINHSDDQVRVAQGKPALECCGRICKTAHLQQLAPFPDLEQADRPILPVVCCTDFAVLGGLKRLVESVESRKDPATVLLREPGTGVFVPRDLTSLGGDQDLERLLEVR